MACIPRTANACFELLSCCTCMAWDIPQAQLGNKPHGAPLNAYTVGIQVIFIYHFAVHYGF